MQERLRNTSRAPPHRPAKLRRPDLSAKFQSGRTAGASRCPGIFGNTVFCRPRPPRHCALKRSVLLRLEARRATQIASVHSSAGPAGFHLQTLLGLRHWRRPLGARTAERALPTDGGLLIKLIVATRRLIRASQREMVTVRTDNALLEHVGALSIEGLRGGSPSTAPRGPHGDGSNRSRSPHKASPPQLSSRRCRTSARADRPGSTDQCRISAGESQCRDEFQNHRSSPIWPFAARPMRYPIIAQITVRQYSLAVLATPYAAAHRHATDPRSGNRGHSHPRRRRAHKTTRQVRERQRHTLAHCPHCPQCSTWISATSCVNPHQRWRAAGDANASSPQTLSSEE